MSRSLWLLTWLICSAAQAQQLDARFTLVCRYGNGIVGISDKNLEVDITSQTVDRRPATIDEGQITQEQENESFSMRLTINRFTGAMKISSVEKKTNRTLPDMIGTCIRPAERKF